MTVTLRVFRVPSALSAGRKLYAAVPSRNWEDGLERLRRDDPIWHGPNVACMGDAISLDESEYKNPRHTPDNIIFWVQ